MSTSFYTQSPTPSPANQLAVTANQLLESLLDGKSRPLHLKQWLHEFSDLIDCLPLSTAEYGLAKIRVRNAVRFIDAEEIGAAKFEIRQLRGGLKGHLQEMPDTRRATFPHRLQRAAINPVQQTDSMVAAPQR